MSGVIHIAIRMISLIDINNLILGIRDISLNGIAEMIKLLLPSHADFSSIILYFTIKQERHSSSYHSRIYYGFSLGLNYKNWGLKANFQGVAHYSVWNTLASVYRPLYGNDKSISRYYLENRWTETTPNARYPRLTTLSNNHSSSSSP